MSLVWVVVGAAAGAPARYAVSRALNRLRGFPWGTLAVNAAGALVLGLVLSRVEHRDPTGLESTVVAFCGAFTTYSAFALETVELGRVRGAVYAAATIGVGVGAATLGWRLG